jgi:hypothetical protein
MPPPENGQGEPNSIPYAILEGMREVIARLVTAFPATPKIDYPDPGEIWMLRSGVGIVGIIINKINVPYVLTVQDLTSGVVVPTPPCPPPPVPLTFKLSVNGLISGHDYSIRIEVAPPSAMAGDQPHTVYVTAI